MFDLTHALLLSLAVMVGAVFVATLIGVPVGVALRWTSTRIHLAMQVVLIVAALTPHYILAAGWEAVWGKFGLIPLTQVGAVSLPTAGVAAVIWIHGVGGAAWMALAVDLLRSPSDDVLIDNAQTDSGPLRIAWFVQLPLARTAWIVAACVTAVRALGEFTVADLYGVRTLADVFYLQYAYEPRVGAITLISVLPLLCLGLAAAILHRRRAAVFSFALSTTGYRRQCGWASILCLGFTVVFAGLPMLATIGKAGWVVQFVDGEPTAAFSFREAIQVIAGGIVEFRRELGWTLALAALVVAIVLPFCWLVLALASPPRGRYRWIIASAALGAFPGPIIAMFWIWVFNRSRPALAGWLYDHTLVPTALAVATPIFFIGMVCLTVVWRMIPNEVCDAADADGATRGQRMISIELPLMSRGLALSGFVVAAFAIMDLSVSILIRPPGVETLSTRLFGLLHSGVRQQEAALTLSWLGIIALMAGIMLGIGKIWRPGR